MLDAKHARDQQQQQPPRSIHRTPTSNQHLKRAPKPKVFEAFRALYMAGLSKKSRTKHTHTIQITHSKSTSHIHRSQHEMM